MNSPTSITWKATSSGWQEMGTLRIPLMYSKSSLNIVDSFLKTATFSETTYKKINRLIDINKS